MQPAAWWMEANKSTTDIETIIDRVMNSNILQLVVVNGLVVAICINWA